MAAKAGRSEGARTGAAGGFRWASTWVRIWGAGQRQIDIFDNCIVKGDQAGFQFTAAELARVHQGWQCPSQRQVSFSTER